jgi:hypothetical protein
VYQLRWKFSGTGASGLVEHRYSDFLSLFQHLQRKFPNVNFPPFPEKKRFVTISERDEVAQDRLEIFKSFVKGKKRMCSFCFFVLTLLCAWFSAFEGPGNELWGDPKVQRFFDLPAELRRVHSHRTSTPTTIRKEVVQKSHQQQHQQLPGVRGHRRRFVIVVLFCLCLV